ncbi:MAG TPA: L-seryl-tRNA(Sec) selenium transferase [Acidimicrobiia bacterium]|nr:L-seryl-tRNA(Sec) selenium transferase [Acidimicrobiia bacterium]
MSDNPYRGLPQVDVLADRIDSDLPRPLVVDAVRAALDRARAQIAAGEPADPESMARRDIRMIERTAGIEIINATGVLLHTNLGRAQWSDGAVARAARAASSYSNLEIDIETGRRSRRGGYTERLITSLTGAEAAFVVNNNASALLLVLAALAAGRAVPVARGELIEIGGSYRLPDVIDASGARLVEVGTTNRTRLDDYVTAVQTHRCGALLKVHPSNYRIEGFTETTTIVDLAKLAARNDLPFVYDIGSGLLDAAAAWVPTWLAGEPGARQALVDGADLVTFSGDKLIGGPQAGIIAGSGDLVETIRRSPLARALRVDGVTYAALSATLEHHMDGPPLDLPFWRQALLDYDVLRSRCVVVSSRIGGVVVEGTSAVGAGSAPGIEIPSPQVRLQSGQGIHGCLLALDRPILTRRDAGDLVIDLRAVDPSDDDLVAAAVQQCL